MMAFQKDFVVSVILNGKPVREFNESGLRTCRIPFNSEYRLRIKSKTWKRALVSITIDGTDVLTGGKQIVLSPYQSVELERFVDDLTEGRKFKFISVEQGAATGEVQDPTSAENGLIRVQVYPEVEVQATIAPQGVTVTSSYRPGGRGMGSSPLRVSSAGGCSTSINSFSGSAMDGTWTISNAAPMGGTFACNTSDSSVMDFGGTLRFHDITDTLERAVNTDKGATAEGSHSSQRFHTTTVAWEAEKTPVTFDLWLKGVRSDVYTDTPQMIIHTSRMIAEVGKDSFSIASFTSLPTGVKVRTSSGAEISATCYSVLND
jgi:hypothetical protein